MANKKGINNVPTKMQIRHRKLFAIPQAQPILQGLPFQYYYVSASLTQQLPLFPSLLSGVLKPEARKKIKLDIQIKQESKAKYNKDDSINIENKHDGKQAC